MTAPANDDGKDQDEEEDAVDVRSHGLPRRSFNTPSFRPPWSVLSHNTQTPLTRRVQAAQQSQSIQTLLEAEKEAAKVVQQARQCTYTGCSHRDPAHLVA